MLVCSPDYSGNKVIVQRCQTANNSRQQLVQAPAQHERCETVLQETYCDDVMTYFISEGSTEY